MTENSENFHMSFICPIDWHIFFPEGFDNFHANQDTLLYGHSHGTGHVYTTQTVRTIPSGIGQVTWYECTRYKSRGHSTIRNRAEIIA